MAKPARNSPDQDLQAQLDWLEPYNWLYESQLFAGAGQLVRRFLDLPADFVLPITFPHGVDTHNINGVEDLNRIEPVYLAVRSDIAERAVDAKVVLRFPHPWLMLAPERSSVRSQGTLFVAPPSGLDNNRNFYEAIRNSSLPKPWGISLKYRGLDPTDHEWWRERGIGPLSAGPANSVDFYPNQRLILQKFDILALACPSSMAVFGATLGRKIIAIPDVEISFVASEESLPLYQLTNNTMVKETWATLLGDDRAAAQAKALDLLGASFIESQTELRRRLFEAIMAVHSPLHFPNVRSGTMKLLLARLLARRVPAHKLLPNPTAAGIRKLRHLLNCDRPWLVETRLFAHYGIMGDPTDAFRYRRYWSFQLGHRPGLGEGPKRPHA